MKRDLKAVQKAFRQAQKRGDDVMAEHYYHTINGIYGAKKAAKTKKKTHGIFGFKKMPIWKV